MYLNLKKITGFCLILFYFSLSVNAENLLPRSEALAPSETGVKGYWNYNYIQPEKKKENKLLIPPAKELWTMDAKKFAELLDETRNKALTTLNQVDVTRYYFLQDVARRKAATFSDKFKNAIQTYNENFGGFEQEFSSVGPARYERQRAKKAEVSRVLDRYRSEYGILYFFQEDCPYCKSADEILQLFDQRNNWVMTKVDVDESPNLVRMFSVRVVPTTILIRKKDKQKFFLTSGTISVMEMEERIVNIIRQVEENKHEMDKTDYFDPYFYLRPENALFLERVLQAQGSSGN